MENKKKYNRSDYSLIYYHNVRKQKIQRDKCEIYGREYRNIKDIKVTVEEGKFILEM